MIKKVIALILSLIVLVYIIFYGNIFEFELNNFQMSVFKNSVIIYLFLTGLCFLVGEVSRNYSQVDKVWSIAPMIYVWFFTYHSDFNSRMILMSILVTVWGVRLTYNFARKSGYSIYFWRGEEDYRWQILKERVPIFNIKIIWSIFNLLFICLYQMGLIFLFSLPILAAWQGQNTPVGISDVLISIAMLVFIITESIADNQQYNFQTTKYSLINNKITLTGDFKKGFLTKGLWSISRHPNFISEQLIWVTFYLFSISSTGVYLNWSIIGCILLIILFYNSANYTESISEKKYPYYKQYKKKVSMFLGFKKINWEED
jgi:steroid 5-alpha reductase family enzyme